MKKTKKFICLCLVTAFTFVLLPGLLQAEEHALAKININTASAEELTQLDGIGPEYAERIIQYREAHGPFSNPEGIMNVQGIGQTIWEANKDRISVE